MDEMIAKYPFSERAKEFLARENILAVSDAELDAGRERVLRGLGNAPWRHDNDPRKEIISYVLARILVSAIGSNAISLRFASYEARNSAELLGKAEETELAAIAGEFFPSLELQGASEARMDVSDYLKFGIDLPNQGIKAGRVHLGKRAFLALLRRAIELKIMDISFDPKTLPSNIRKKAGELSADAQKYMEEMELPRAAFSGKYLSLKAMRRILEGLPEGKRYYGSMTLAIACLKDGLGKGEAEQLMVTYARNCGRSTHAYTEKEALASLEWVYKHPTINFSMKTLKEQGLVDAATLRETEEQYAKMAFASTGRRRMGKVKYSNLGKI